MTPSGRSTAISSRLLEIADEIQSGKVKTDKAIKEALKLMETGVKRL